jgi:hypothetical protein
VHIDHGKKAAIVIRYVYDAATADVQSGIQQADDDPNRPLLRRHSDDSNSSGAQDSQDADSSQPAPNASASPSSDDGNSPNVQSTEDADPNRPVLKRHSDSGSSPQ